MLPNVVAATKEKDNSITLTIDEPASNARVTKRYADVRMGLHWPTSHSPACFVIVSQQYTGPHKPGEGEPPVGTREVLAEYVPESLGMNQFYRQVGQMAKKLFCRRVYAVLPEDRMQHGHLQDLMDYARESDCDIYVHEALDDGEFFLSISRIKDSIDDGNLLVPDNTVVYDQLKGMTREDLKDSPEEFFYCIDALGHVIDGYYRWPPRNYQFYTRRRPPPDWRYH